jgi:hypothetical protein
MQSDEIKNVQPLLQQHNVTGSLPFARFASNNEIRFGQDFRFWQGLPDDVNFYPIEETQNGYIVFVGDGYGIRSEHKLAGKYGNGAVFVVKDDIPDLVEWCRANFL